MRAMSFVALAVLCTAGMWACSDDEGGTPGAGGSDQDVGELQGQGGSGMGGSSGSAGSAGNPADGAQGGSMSNTGGTDSESGAGGEGMAGSTMGGTDGGESDAGAPVVPDAGGQDPGGEDPGGEEPGGEDPGGEDPGGEDPGAETVTFTEVFPILRQRCGNCHSNPNGLPAFAQANIDASFAVTQNPGEMGMDISQRIIVQAVQLRTMPLACGGGMLGSPACLTVPEAELLQAWFDDGAPR